ncbi:MAG: patatin-like phospholipase family protein [Chloroflexi bacterium]|nr:patatin-like phospholipase family protein [Chloroflexota bacterium]
MHRPFGDEFTLALGGGGARGWAHVGVARALREHRLRPRRIVGTSMGAIVGATLAAGRAPEEIEDGALRAPFHRLTRRRGRFALFDPRGILEHLADELGDPRIEDLPTPLGITAYDLVAGAPRLITRGRLVDALEKSIAVPFFFPPRPDAEGVWCDAGPWEGVPVTLARRWAPDAPVIGVLADIPKPAFLASRPGAAFLRAASRRLGGAGAAGDRLTARRYLALLTSRWADPVVREPPDLLVVPRLGRMNALQFGRVAEAIAIGERDTLEALATIGARSTRTASDAG